MPADCGTDYGDVECMAHGSPFGRFSLVGLVYCLLCVECPEFPYESTIHGSNIAILEQYTIRDSLPLGSLSNACRVSIAS